MIQMDSQAKSMVCSRSLATIQLHQAIIRSWTHSLIFSMVGLRQNRWELIFQQYQNSILSFFRYP